MATITKYKLTLDAGKSLKVETIITGDTSTSMETRILPVGKYKVKKVENSILILDGMQQELSVPYNLFTDAGGTQLFSSADEALAWFVDNFFVEAPGEGGEILDAAKAYTDESVEVVANGQKPAVPSDSPTEGIFVYPVSTAGTYTNFGGVVVSSGDLASNLVQLRYQGGSWVKVLTAVPFASDSAVAGKNRFDKTAIINGYYVNGNTGELLASGAYKASNAFAIPEKTYISLSGLGTVHYAIGVRFLNDSDDVVGYIYSPQNIESGTLLTPAGTTKMQFTVKTGKSGDNMNLDNIQVEIGSATSYEPVKRGVENVQTIPVISTYAKYGGTSKMAAISKQDLDERFPFSSLKGKTIIGFGDSIMAATGGFFEVAAKIMNVNSVKYAYSGGRIVDWAVTDNERQKLSVQIADAISDSVTPDLGLIAIGTNDIASSTTGSLGDQATAMGKTINSLDKTLIYEALRWAFYTLTYTFPNTKWFYSLPLQRALYTYDRPFSLLDAIKKMCSLYGIVVIDSFGESGIIKDFEVSGSAGRWLQDGLHPSPDGHQLYGKFIARKIMSNI